MSHFILMNRAEDQKGDIIHMDELIEYHLRDSKFKPRAKAKIDGDKLDLSEDIYCVSFIKFMEDDPNTHKELMLKSVIAFSFQICLISLIMWE